MTETRLATEPTSRPASGVPLDVRSLFFAKNPRAARRMPLVLMRLLARVIHEREIRRFVEATRGCTACEFVERALEMLRVRVECDGEERIPDGEPVVICANHPTGGIDGLVLMHLLCRRYGGLQVPANDLLLALPALTELIAPVDKFGSNRLRAAAYAQMYGSRVPVLVFPAGRTARYRGGMLREFEWDKAFIKYARRHGRSIVPVHLSGRNTARFYAIWRLRRVLGIRANLEMLLLVDELFRRRGTTVRVRFGDPVDPGQPRGPRYDRALAGRLRRRVERGLPRETSTARGPERGTPTPRNPHERSAP